MQDIGFVNWLLTKPSTFEGIDVKDKLSWFHLFQLIRCQEKKLTFLWVSFQIYFYEYY